MSQASFLDPVLTSDGRPFAPIRYSQIVEERYLISKYTNSSYVDIGKITPMERNYILNFIRIDLEREQEIREQVTKNKQIQPNHRYGRR